MSTHSVRSRRAFLQQTASVCAGSVLARDLLAEHASTPASAPGSAPAGADLGFPLVDLHVHLDNSTIDKVLPLSRKRHVKFGIVEHAGTKENVYPTVLSNDDELRAYLRMLDGKGVYKGVQTEWTDWVRCFSREALAGLDYILTDAMTFPGKDGKRVKLWEPSVEQRVEMSDRQAFMDRLVDWNVRIITEQPIDILANVSWLPAPLADEYDTFWTQRRIHKVVDAAVKHHVAIEISSGFKLPKLHWLEIAKAAGCKFTFGSNGRYPSMGLLDYSIGLARQLDLEPADMFTPDGHGPGRIRSNRRDAERTKTR